jgi:hypothetical protein
MSPNIDLTEISSDGARWALRQIAIHHITPGVDQTVLITMAMHADDQGRLHPSLAQIASLLNATSRAVKLAVNSFLALGIMTSTSEWIGQNEIVYYQLATWAALSSADLYKLPLLPPGASLKARRHPL